MTLLTWADYEKWLNKLGCLVKISSPAPNVDQFCTDTRLLKPGDWFIPLVGENFDGHQFIERALQKGADGFLFSRAHSHRISPLHLSKGIEVNNTLEALHQIAKGWRSILSNTTVFSLTGSSGKTSVKEMLASILRTAGTSYATEKNFNNDIGVPLTINQLKEHHQYAVLEFGARHLGDISLLNEIARPNVVCLLNIGQAHLGEFGSLENLITAKFEIFTSSPADSKWVINADDPNLKYHFNKLKSSTLFFGKDERSDVKIDEFYKIDSHKMFLRLLIHKKKLEIHLPFYHDTHPLNAAASCAMALAAQIDLGTMKKGLENISPVRGRFFEHKINQKVVIDDAYNANPESMIFGLTTLENLYKTSKKIIVLGDMLELGEETTNFHKKIGLFCFNHLSFEKIITVGRYSSEINAELLSLGTQQSKIYHYSNSGELAKEIISHILDVDVIYFKGSNSINLNIVIQVLLTKL